METKKVEKRNCPDDLRFDEREPILVRVEHHNIAPCNIQIDKTEFSVGRGRDNDEIILDPMISRKHCVFKCEGNKDWSVTNLSSSCTFVNDVLVESGSSKILKPGDILQFSTSSDYRYVFTFNSKEEHISKKPRLEDDQLFDMVLTEQKTFAENQETQKKVLKDQLQIKQKEQEDLKQHLSELLEQQKTSIEDTQGLKNQIAMLEAQIMLGIAQEEHLQKMYDNLLQQLENERLQFEAKLNEEKQKWEEALNLTRQEKESLQQRMVQELETCRLKLQTTLNNEIENRVKEEKNIQAQLMNEKTLLEKKLKETETALQEQKAKAETALNSRAGPAGIPMEDCIFLELIETENVQPLQVLDTIDLTVPSPTPPIVPEAAVLEKVSGIMDEQLTCSVCSELFVKAATLNCTHTFCQHCIKLWMKKSKECPICRTRIVSMNRSLVVDNFIEKMLETLPADHRIRREELINERVALKKKKKVH